MVSCATVKSPLGLLKCILIVSCLTHTRYFETGTLHCPHIYDGACTSSLWADLDHFENLSLEQSKTYDTTN